MARATLTVARRAAIAAAILVVAGAAGSEPAEASFRTGLGGFEFTTGNAGTRDHWFDRTADAGASYARIQVPWRSIATRRPSDPANPGDPAYNFAATDAAVRGAVKHGLRPQLWISNAPDYAEGPGRPNSVRPGTWLPDPGEVAAFARALANRYSGGFAGLPRVRHFQLWNEPNLPDYLNPQWVGRRPVAAVHYRLMLNAFYRAIKSANRSNVVLTAGTAPYGERRGGKRMRPLVFWRKVLCVRRKGGRLAGKKCPRKPKFDVLAHHPINTSGGPTRSARHRDDVSTPDLGALRRTLRAAERAHRIAGKRRRHELWATEIWWESNPPDTFSGVPVARHARYIQQALYLLWKADAAVVMNLNVHDAKYDPNNSFGSVDAGLYFADGTPKPALRAFRFPFVTERASAKRVRAWGRAPRRAKVRIERARGRGWRTIARTRARRDGVFTARLRLRGSARLRARAGGEVSLVWRQRR